jgi:MFS transporter, DHA1 family, inner membrane transport protein
VIATVPLAQRGRGLSITFLGMSMSYAIGLPLGAWFAARYDASVPLWIVVAAAFVMMLAMFALVPKSLTVPPVSFSGLGKAVFAPAVLRTWVRTACYFVAIFCGFAYSAPVLQAIVPMSAEKLSFTLAAFGVSGVIGTLTGGILADRLGALPSLKILLGVLASMMLIMPLTRGNYPLMLGALMLWGTAGFGLMPPNQLRLASLNPPLAPMLLSLNASVLYLGTALGTAIAGAAIGPVGYLHLVWVGLPFALTALAVCFWDE